MEWYKILIEIILGLGGLAGIGAFIKVFLFAKQEKASKEIDNKSNEVKTLLDIIEELRKEHAGLREEFNTYKSTTSEYVAEFKGRFAALEADRNNLKIATLEAYRCTLPKTPDDCPVLHHLKQSQACEECKNKKNNQ